MEYLISIIRYLRKNPLIADCLLVMLLTIPAFVSLFYRGYPSMHDDQHIVRLFLFDKALWEGNLYPRWVDGLGFGYGYPLFNFYPPLIYFVAEVFHLLGFSFIWSIKLMVVSGFLLAAVGMYLFVRKLYNWQAGIIASVLYTYFFYHGVTAYVRGAFAEFFTLSIIPFIFLAIVNLFLKTSIKNTISVSLWFALLVLCHPLIALPSLIFIGGFFLFLYFQNEQKKRTQFVIFSAIGMVLGLGLSTFFWLPSIIERSYTYVDEVFIGKAGSYANHFIYPHQLWQSLWNYGGSVAGPADGFTFQLGKVHIALAVLSIFVIVVLFFLKKNKATYEKASVFFVGMFFFSIFMTLDYSKFIWDTVSLISYMQYPWRFLTFTAFFISIVGSVVVYYMFKITGKLQNTLANSFAVGSFFVVLFVTIFVYSKYFHPQSYRQLTDADLTSKEEVSWRVSESSFEFVPKGIITTQSAYGTTRLDISKEQIPSTTYTLKKGNALIQEEEMKSSYKSYIVKVGQPVAFQLNTFNFPGWKASLQEAGQTEVKELAIRDDNPFKLITVDLPPGEYVLSFEFADTPLRFTANIITLVSVILYLVLQWKQKELTLLISRNFKQE